MVVDAGPAAAVGNVNVPYVTVTICTPGGASCQTIDHVSVDTGSSGLRILASALPAGFNLPQAQDGSGQPLNECLQFADGYSWGSVRTADLKVAGEQASGIAIQLIGDPAAPAAPASCVSGPSENTVAAFGANGLLGVAVFHEDCGPGCTSGAPPGWYYVCPATGCTPTSVPLAEQLHNPVAHFATDNNGVILQLPAIGSAGAETASGTLLFGIDTQGNNAMGSATVVTVDNGGNFVTMLNGQRMNGYIDSGSNALFFASSISACKLNTDFYCPASVQTLNATNQSASGTGSVSTVSFNVAAADTLFANNATFTAFDNLAGSNTPGGFDWGLPFFYGRKVFVAIEGQNTSAGLGPLFAY
jgi:hypothetical protein